MVLSTKLSIEMKLSSGGGRMTPLVQMIVCRNLPHFIRDLRLGFRPTRILNLSKPPSFHSEPSAGVSTYQLTVFNRIARTPRCFYVVSIFDISYNITVPKITVLSIVIHICMKRRVCEKDKLHLRIAYINYNNPGIDNGAG